jgi:Fe-S cluster assembly protein SufB
LPSKIRKRLGLLASIERRRSLFAAISAHYESESLYHSIDSKLAGTGLIFCSTDLALKLYPKLFKNFFGKLVGPGNNKFAALNCAMWSGGTFIYVPPKLKLSHPLYNHFSIHRENLGQFERTLIIADRDSELHYIEGCNSTKGKVGVHAGVVEIFVMEGASVRYSTAQNWSTKIYNLVTKKAVVMDNASIEWIDSNLGAATTMKYPSVILKGKNSKAKILSVTAALDKKQTQDTGVKIVHLGKGSRSIVVSKSISRNGGTTTYRGFVKVEKEASASRSFVKCDTLILDKNSKANSFPSIESKNSESTVSHETTASNFDEEKIFYLQLKGLSGEEAISVVTSGFVEPVIKELPIEYAVEIEALFSEKMRSTKSEEKTEKIEIAGGAKRVNSCSSCAKFRSCHGK